MKARGLTRLKAGVFISVSLLVLVTAILLIGQKSALFVSTRTYYVYYRDASGLVPGAPVRLAGVDVGTVTAIAFPEDPSLKQTRIAMVVPERYAHRIRKDTMAYVDSKGLLGDKLVNLTFGDPALPELPDGATIKAGETISFEAMAREVQEAVASVSDIAEEARSFVVHLKGEQLGKDMSTVVGSLGRILAQVEEGDGTVHRLIYDQRMAQEIDQVIVEARKSVVQIRSAVERVDGVLAEVQHGDGTLHEVVYGQQGTQALTQLRTASSEIAAVIREVREGEGLLHTLVYGEGNTDFLLELNEFAATLNRMAQEMEKGRGTLGGLLVDPTVYEDMKSVLGNIERNVLLKALIRFTIDNEEIRRPEP